MKLPEDPSYLLDIKALLKMAGFSQNGCNRIMHLTGVSFPRKIVFQG